MAPAKKKITIDDLAIITQKGFTESRGEMQAGFKASDVRLEKIEKDVILLKADSFLIRGDLKEIKNEVKEMKENSGELFKKLDDFISRMQRQEQETVFLASQMKRLEERVDKLEARRK